MQERWSVLNSFSIFHLHNVNHDLQINIGHLVYVL
jgi:hypothetical protein